MSHDVIGMIEGGGVGLRGGGGSWKVDQFDTFGISSKINHVHNL